MSRGVERERGSTLVVFVLCVGVLFGIASLVIDLGNARQLDEKAQGASDAGAMAAAQDLPSSGSDSVATATAKQVAATYAAFPYGEPPVAVTCSGSASADTACHAVGADVRIEVTSPYDGSDQKLHVRVCEDTPTFFAGAFGLTSPTACSYGVAFMTEESSVAPAVLVLSEHDCGAFELHSSADVVAANGTVQVDSDCNGAITQEGSSATVTADTCVCVVGGETMNNPENATPTVTEGAPVGVNPYASVPVVPEPGTAGSMSGTTIYPGTFTSTLELSGNSTFNMQPGIYYLKNGLKMEGTANLHGHGVLIYLQSGRLDIGGDPHRFHLTPLSSTDDPTWQYQDIVLYQAPGNTTQGEYGDQTFGGSQSGSGCIIDHNYGGFEGGLYYPNATLKLRGTVTLCALGPIVVNQLNLEGSSFLYADASGFSSVSPPQISLID